MRGDKNMGVFETIFRKPKADLKAEGYFKMLNGYTPVFSNAPESIYEMELTRAAIHSFASFASKLKPEISGTAQKNLERTLQFKPNPFMDTSKFIYRIATILSVNNTCFIVPIEDEFGGLIGYYPLLPQRCEVVEYNGAPFLRYTFGSGQKAAIEFERVGVMTQFQYTDDFFGESNAALRPTMQLIHTQNQGIINGVKNSASIRFLAKVANMLKPEDITKERKRFTADNLSAENQSGMVIYDAKFADVKPIESKPFTVNAAQMAQINENVFNYFGTNAGILQNKYTEDEWNAYYEGKIEPFAIQLSLVMSNMTYTARELSFGNAITFTANRLQYASNQTKLNISTQLFDRGLLNRNGVMDVWNMAHVEGGEKYYIRKEYAEVSELGKEVTPNAKKTDREYRTMIQPLLIPTAAEKRIDTDFYVEGYATTFDKPYLLYEWDGNKYYERIDRNALAGADMSDVIMQYNHEGKVLARISNGTLGVEANDNGLFTFADLSKSRAAQDMFEEIKNGLVTKMSWAFRVSEDSYDRDTRTRTILKIAKVYDVSAVSIPANADTDISARSYFDGVIEREQQERLERRKKLLKIKLMTEV